MRDKCKIISVQRKDKAFMIYLLRAVCYDVYNLSAKLFIHRKLTRSKSVLRHVLMARANHVTAVRHNP